MRHTPPPWAVLDKTGKRFAVTIIHPDIGTIATIHTPRSWGEGLATAKLIAEAPALRDLLAEIVYPTRNETFEQWRERAQAALTRLEEYS